MWSNGVGCFKVGDLILPRSANLGLLPDVYDRFSRDGEVIFVIPLR